LHKTLYHLYHYHYCFITCNCPVVILAILCSRYCSRHHCIVIMLILYHHHHHCLYVVFLAVYFVLYRILSGTIDQIQIMKVFRYRVVLWSGGIHFIKGVGDTIVLMSPRNRYFVFYPPPPNFAHSRRIPGL